MNEKETVIDYHIIQIRDISNLQEEVSKFISSNYGWQPSGGVTVVPDEKGQYYAQAMVKYDLNPTVFEKKIENGLAKIQATLSGMKLSIF